VPEWAEAVYHLFVVRVADRTTFQARLKQRGIETAVHYPHALHLLPAYARLGHKPGDFPNAEDTCATCVSLPMHPHITEDEVAEVAGAVREALAS
jgi:dTDP-4-amino-4,6-dideoxygalactose transaminase